MIPNTLHTKWGTAKVIQGYYTITSSKEGNNGKRLHRLIYENFYDVQLPSQIHIHHKDENSLNNCILNLEAMSVSEHSKYHMNGEKHWSYGLKGKDNPNYGSCRTPETCKNISNSLKGKEKSKESIEKMRKSLTGKKQAMESMLKRSHSLGSSGIFRVYKKKSNNKQGFVWCYRYYENNKRIAITSINLDKLKEKVFTKGLEWIEFDKEDI